MKTHDTHSATCHAENVLSALFEARIAADFYVEKADKVPYARRFIKQLYLVEGEADALYHALSQSGNPFRAIHNAAIDGRSPSVHDHLALAGMDVTGNVASAILTAFAATTDTPWPPRGEHLVPALPCENDFMRYVEIAVGAFRKTGPNLELLNELSARLQQEVAGGNKTDNEPGKSAEWPKQADVARRLGTNKTEVHRLIGREALRTNGKKGHDCRVDPASILEYCKETGTTYNET